MVSESIMFKICRNMGSDEIFSRPKHHCHLISAASIRAIVKGTLWQMATPIVLPGQMWGIVGRQSSRFPLCVFVVQSLSPFPVQVPSICEHARLEIRLLSPVAAFTLTPAPEFFRISGPSQEQGGKEMTSVKNPKSPKNQCLHHSHVLDQPRSLQLQDNDFPGQYHARERHS